MTALFDSVLTEIHQTLKPVSTFLRSADRPWVNSVFEKVEKKSNNKVKREHIAYVGFGLVALYFIIGSLAQILCNTVGFVYPAFASIRAVRGSVDPCEVRHWLIYWIVFACFSLVDLSAFAAVPFYWLAKVMFLVYLYFPTVRGATVIYNNYIDPTMSRIEAYTAKSAEKTH